MNYREILKSKLNQLKSESRYRTFIELERQTGWHPHALWNSPDGPKDVVIWCSNDYLGMGQNPDVVKSLTAPLMFMVLALAAPAIFPAPAPRLLRLRANLPIFMARNVPLC